MADSWGDLGLAFPAARSRSQGGLPSKGLYTGRAAAAAHRREAKRSALAAAS